MSVIGPVEGQNVTGELVIPATVTYIGNAYSVTTIGEDAFSNCMGSDYCIGLTNVTIPNSVTSIGNGAFCGCAGLTNVTIPNSVTSIGDAAFGACSALTNVSIPNSVTSIGDAAFAGCEGLTNITIPNSVTSIGTTAFENCYELTSVSIPNSVTSIGYAAFWGCIRLASVTIPNSVTSIGKSAFQGCSRLTTITIPNSVTSIGDVAFGACSGIEEIIVDSENKIYDSRKNSNAIIEKSTNTLILGCKNTVIPKSVTSIGGWAFYGCSELTSITIPNSVISIGGEAFRDCTELASVIIKSSRIPDLSFNDYFYGCTKLDETKIIYQISTSGETETESENHPIKWILFIIIGICLTALIVALYFLVMNNIKRKKE